MKIVCECGNESTFNNINEDTDEVNAVSEDEGQYTTIKKFRFWQAHDQVGIVCKKCDKSIWLFT